MSTGPSITHSCESWIKIYQFSYIIMTSSNGNIFRVTGPLCGDSPVPVNSPHKGQWRGALMDYLICVWINGWVNNREAGDLRRYRAHYDVIVMWKCIWKCHRQTSVMLFVHWSEIDEYWFPEMSAKHCEQMIVFSIWLKWFTEQRALLLIWINFSPSIDK